MLLSVLLAVVTATASPTPSPAATSSAAPLKTIITVKSSAFCSEFANHMNAAVSSAVTNDVTLGTTVVTLKSGDLAGSSIDRMNEIHRLEQLANAIYAQYKAGEGQVAQLRSLAASATDASEKAELKAAADALGGVLYRQHLIQRDLDGFVAFLDAADMRSDINTPQVNVGATPFDPTLNMSRGSMRPNDPALPVYMQSAMPGEESPEQDVRFASNAADDFMARRMPIRSDELQAAEHIDGVSQYCQ